VKPVETAFAGYGSVNTPVARQRLISSLVLIITDTDATMKELLEAMFSVRSMQRLIKENQLPLRDSLDSAVRSGNIKSLPALSFKILSRVRGLRDKNKRGFSGFNEGMYLNPCRDYTQQT
jgi:hypothetical protein